jgi:hypothetical protein
MLKRDYEAIFMTAFFAVMFLLPAIVMLTCPGGKLEPTHEPPPRAEPKDEDDVDAHIGIRMNGELGVCDDGMCMGFDTSIGPGF